MRQDFVSFGWQYPGGIIPCGRGGRTGRNRQPVARWNGMVRKKRFGWLTFLHKKAIASVQVMAGLASVLGMYLAIRLPMGIQQGACCPFPKKQYNGGMKITSEVAYEVYPFV